MSRARFSTVVLGCIWLLGCAQNSTTLVSPTTDLSSIMTRADNAFLRKDYPEAFRLNSIAAELGDARAQNNLCAFYIDGLGTVLPNRREAMKWCQQAAAGAMCKPKRT